MILFAAVASAASFPTSTVNGPPQMEDPGAWTPPPRVVTKLPEVTYRALDRRHQPAISWGFVVSGIGIPVAVTGVGIAAFGAFADSGDWFMVGANMVGVGIAANVTGAVIGMRSLTMYHREMKDLKADRLDLEGLLAKRACHIRPYLTANGVGGTF